MNKIHYQSLLTLLTFLISNSLVFGTTAVDINDIAQSYVKLVLEIGLYEPDYAETYFGPPEWIPSDDEYEEEFPSEIVSQEADALNENHVWEDNNTTGRWERLNQLLSTPEIPIALDNINFDSKY